MNHIETEIVKASIREAEVAGFELRNLYDGDTTQRCVHEDAACELLNDLDEGYLHFFNPTNKRKAWARFIFDNGNGGRDVMCDYSDVTKAFSDAMVRASNCMGA